MRFLRDRRALVAVMFALAAVPLMLAIGVGVDGMRVWLVRSRLITSIDAAALAGARNLNIPVATRDTEVTNMFWTNFQKNAIDPTGTALVPRWFGFMGASTADPLICALPNPKAGCAGVEANTLRVTGTARVPTTFLRLTKIFFGSDNDFVDVSWTGEARRADLGMEVSLVLDVTGSMGANGVVSPIGSANPVSNIDALRLAAGDLVNILYGPNETLDNLRVAVVPYTTTVNIGTANEAWLNAPIGNRYSPVTWRGCVEARYLNQNDRNDATPAIAPFTPYFAPSTLQASGQPFYTVTATGNRVIGDNDWMPRLYSPTATQAQNDVAITEMWQDTRGNDNVGPNLGCPALRILPLTASKTTVLNHILAVRSTFRGGTMHNIGMQAGWFTLSPNWRGWWPDATRPLAYGTPFLQKVVVILTDGESNWNDYNAMAPGLCSDTGINNATIPAGASPRLRPLGCPAAAAYPAGVTVAAGGPPLYRTGTTDPNTDYSGYGRLLENRLGIAVPHSQARMTTELNARFSSLCTDMKQRGITIYTITFNTTNAAVQTLFRNCATLPENYFNSPTQATLRAAFQQIGTQLANLRLSQ